MTFNAEQIDWLKAPLSRSNVKERKMAGRVMSYVEGWHVIAEANRIFGFDGWTSETILLQETNRDLVTLESDRGQYKQWRIGYIAKVRITAGGVVREGVGYGSGMGKPEAVGDAVEGAIKEAETDSRKRALMMFGSQFGLALYDKTQSEVEDAPKTVHSKAPVTPAQPKPVPAAVPQQAQPETPLTGATAPTITPADWLKKAIDRVKGLDRAGMDEFSEKHHLRIAKCRTVEPLLYEALMEAIRKRHEALG